MFYIFFQRFFRFIFFWTLFLHALRLVQKRFREWISYRAYSRVSASVAGNISEGGGVTVVSKQQQRKLPQQPQQPTPNPLEETFYNGLVAIKNHLATNPRPKLDLSEVYQFVNR